MRGHIQQRGPAAWRLYVYLGKDPVTGKDRMTTRTIHGTRKQAEDELARLIVEVRDGRHSLAVDSVAAHLERWYATRHTDWSPNTAKLTRRTLDTTILPALGDTKLAKLRADDIDLFYSRLRTRTRPLQPATIRRIHGILRLGLQQAVRWGLLVDNPADRAQPPRLPRHEIQPPTPAQVAKLLALAETDDPPAAVFFRLAATTGARRGELCALRWTDINLDDGQITVARSVLASGPPVEKDTKTHASRKVNVGAATIVLLRKHRAAMAARAVECGAGLTADAFVFSNDPACRTPMWPTAMTRAFRRARNRAGLPHVRLHDLRHYVATQALGAGHDIRNVAARLGHASPNVTLAVYAHALPTVDRAIADSADQWLEPPKRARQRRAGAQ